MLDINWHDAAKCVVHPTLVALSSILSYLFYNWVSNNVETK